MAYSDQQVADFLRQQGLVGGAGGVNTGGIYSAAQQYGVDASQLDRVGAGQGWWGNTGATDWVKSHGLSGGIGTGPQAPGAAPTQPGQYSSQQIRDYVTGNGWADASTGAVTNPNAIYGAAQKYGVSADQLDQAGRWKSGTAGGWASANGLNPLNGGSGGSATSMPVTGGGQMTSYPAQQQAGGSAGGNPYMQGGGQQRPPNPYLQQQYGGWGSSQQQGGHYGPDDRWIPDPGGGQGSNMGNDPRMGGPGQWGGGNTGNQGLGGAAQYLWDNPNTMAMGNELTRNVNNNLQRNILPGIRGGAMASGGVGGSRQGVAEGLATGESMRGLAGALAGLYGNQYNQDRQYGLQNDALDLSVYGVNQGVMRQGQLDQINGMSGILGNNMTGLQTANTAAQTPFTNWQRFVGPASQMGGLGGSTSQQMQGNPYLGAIGGYMAGSKLFGG